MTANSPAQELARNMSLFEIDEALGTLIESAYEEAAANGGELSEQLLVALADYVEAFGEKVDRIANYLKGQQSFAELAKREEERLHARRRAAENRAKGLKIFLCCWMGSRGLKLAQGTAEHDHARQEQRRHARGGGKALRFRTGTTRLRYSWTGTNGRCCSTCFRTAPCANIWPRQAWFRGS